MDDLPALDPGSHIDRLTGLVHRRSLFPRLVGPMLVVVPRVLGEDLPQVPSAGAAGCGRAEVVTVVQPTVSLLARTVSVSPVPCQNSHNCSELVFSVPVRLLAGTR